MDAEDWLPSEIERLNACADSDEVVRDIEQLLLQTDTFDYVFQLRTRLAILYKRQYQCDLAIDQYTILIALNADEPRNISSYQTSNRHELILKKR